MGVVLLSELIVMDPPAFKVGRGAKQLRHALPLGDRAVSWRLEGLELGFEGHFTLLSWGLKALHWGLKGTSLHCEVNNVVKFTTL